MILLILILIITTFLTYEQNSSPLYFISLRLLKIVAFIIIVNYFAIQTYRNNTNIVLENNLVSLGFLFSVVTIVTYILHTLNLQEINVIDLLKNRLTTGGGTEYIYSFKFNFDNHSEYYSRAIGTFREPSLLLKGLLLPFFLALKNHKNFAALVIGCSMYLTYSLAFFISIVFGLMLSLLIVYRSSLFSKKFFLGIFIIIISLYLLNKYGLSDSNIYFQRMINLTENNSRDYIYKNLDVILGGNYWFGNGIGFGFFNLTEHIFGNTLIPTSFLSVPLNFWSAGGIMSLIIIMIWILFHNLSTLIYLKGFNRNLYLLLSVLNVYLLLYFVSYEELHIWHAIALGIYLSYLNDVKPIVR
jgi:hypothetical protein